MSVTASVVNGTQITWTAGGPQPDYDHMTLSWSGSNGTSGSVTFLGQTTTSHSPSVTVSGSVIGFWPGGSASLGSASATTAAAGSPPNSLAGLVSASASGEAPATVTFQWQNPGGGTSSYNYSTTVDSGNTTSLQHQIGPVNAGTYSISVTPINAYGSGGSGSASVTVAAPSPPPAGNAVTHAVARGSTQFEWFISGLGNPFNTTYYQAVAVFTSPFSNDSATQPFGLISSTAASNGTSTTTPTILTSGAVSADQSYTVYGGAQAANGRWYTAGEKTFWTRPLDFAWTTAKTKDANFSLLATEWNALTSKIDGFSLYKELGTTFFTTAYANNIFTAAMFIQVRDAIAALTPPLAAPGTVAAGDSVLASQLNGLRNSLNSIP